MRTPKPVVALDRKHLDKLIAKAIGAKGPLCDLNHIDVSGISDFRGLFQKSAFNGSVAKWDMSNALSLARMFAGSAFNGDLSQWNLRSVHFMQEMFKDSSFNGDIARWNMPLLRDSYGMFENGAFNGDLSRWRLPNLSIAYEMFQNCPFNGDVAQWGADALNDARGMFNTPAFQQDLSTWRIPKHCPVHGMFHRSFNGHLPRIATHSPSESYQEILGRFEDLVAYAARSPFQYVHAALLLEDEQDCEWASQEEVRWAQEMRAMGRAMGMDREAVLQLMVVSHANLELNGAVVDSSVFDSALTPQYAAVAL